MRSDRWTDGGALSDPTTILRAAVAAADPFESIRRCLVREGRRLSVGGRDYDLSTIRNVVVIGAGKAACPMAAAVEEIVGGGLRGLVVTKAGAAKPLKSIAVREAAHPVPDRSGMAGVEAIFSQLKGLSSDDLVIVLISGGASALLPAPVEGVTLAQKQRTTRLLLESGAPIQEINAVRKHLSEIKGGRLAARLAPAQAIVLILSDVLGNDLSSIGSGPTAPDPTTFEDAVSVLRRRGVWAKLPAAVRGHLSGGARGRWPETPKPGDSAFQRIQNLIVGDNGRALEAAADAARQLGYQTLVLSSTLQGEAREVARVFGEIAREIRNHGRPIERPACVLAGGELTVTIRGKGKGGRAQEFALAGALAIHGLPETALAGFGTDGNDGPTEAAGALADGGTLRRASRVGLDPYRALAANDAYPFFRKLGDLLITGPTGTNVNDIHLLLIR